jgi:hypothetical protein
MNAASDDLGVSFPTHLSLNNKYHVRAYAMDLAEVVMELHCTDEGMPASKRRRYMCPY